jgi:hypothetical protein
MWRKDSLLELIKMLDPYSKHADKRRRMTVVKENIEERNKKYNNKKDTYWYKVYLKEGIKIKKYERT